MNGKLTNFLRSLLPISAVLALALAVSFSYITAQADTRAGSTTEVCAAACDPSDCPVPCTGPCAQTPSDCCARQTGDVQAGESAEAVESVGSTSCPPCPSECSGKSATALQP